MLYFSAFEFYTCLLMQWTKGIKCISFNIFPVDYCASKISGTGFPLVVKNVFTY